MKPGNSLDGDVLNPADNVWQISDSNERPPFLPGMVLLFMWHFFAALL